jgi:hypothetical protein
MLPGATRGRQACSRDHGAYGLHYYELAKLCVLFEQGVDKQRVSSLSCKKQ